MSNDNLNPENTPVCGAIGDNLSAYLDGELPKDERDALEAHLRDCDDCRTLCDALAAIRRDIAAAELSVPPHLHERTMLRIRRENRMRRLRRITAVASAGVAAMFCFVVIGGALTRGAGADMAANDFAYFADAAAEKAAPAPAEADVRGASLDTSLEGELTVVATGRSGDAAEDALLYSASEIESTVVYARIPSAERPLITEETAKNNASAQSKCLSDDTFHWNIAEENARLAEIQLGTLCILEIPADGADIVRVYDLTTGKTLSLADFLGASDAPEALARSTGLPLTADTPYRPTAEGLCLSVQGVELILEWSSHPLLSACIERYAMTDTPLCLSQNAEIRH